MPEEPYNIMNNKKYQVFISSTYTDLIEERRKVLDVLLTADCIPAGMEAFVATDVEQFKVIKKVIDFCDYYVLIIGKRYGSISPETGKSYTEMEYDYAINQGIPVLVFALDESVNLPVEKTDTEPEMVEKLQSFRKKAMTNRMATVWSTTDDLTGRLAISIMKAIDEMKRPGWQRSVDFDEASLRREIMSLQSEKEKLIKDNSEKQHIIDSLTQTTNLAFEDCDISFDYHYYAKYSSAGRTKNERIDKNKNLSLTEIFKVVSIEMLDVAISENTIEKVIISKFFDEKEVYFSDSQVIKIVLNQLKELELIYSQWSKNKIALFWGLTEKGKKVRNDMTLIRNNSESS